MREPPRKYVLWIVLAVPELHDRLISGCQGQGTLDGVPGTRRSSGRWEVKKTFRTGLSSVCGGEDSSWLQTHIAQRKYGMHVSRGVLVQARQRLRREHATCEMCQEIEWFRG